MPKGDFCYGAGAGNIATGTVSVIRPRYLFVVSRQHQYLYELLIERFRDDRNVEVILDRRMATSEAPQMYGEDRRRRPANELGTRSHLIITRPD